MLCSPPFHFSLYVRRPINLHTLSRQTSPVVASPSGGSRLRFITTWRLRYVSPTRVRLQQRSLRCLPRYPSRICHWHFRNAPDENALLPLARFSRCRFWLRFLSARSHVIIMTSSYDCKTFSVFPIFQQSQLGFHCRPFSTRPRNNISELSLLVSIPSSEWV